jgi:hypothetical protein
MTEQEEFNTACSELSSKIAKFYDNIEDQTLIVCALIPLVSQTILNVAYEREAPITGVLEMVCGDIRICTHKIHAFMEVLHKTEGTAQ